MEMVRKDQMEMKKEGVRIFYQKNALEEDVKKFSQWQKINEEELERQ